jgi:hypothetical protein
VAIAALAVAALGAPAALAQNAGDDQYQDPFGEVEQGGETERPAPEADPPPAPSSSPPASGTASAGASAGTSQPTGEALPRTGGAPKGLALAGVLLLATGAILRLRLTPWGIRARGPARRP